MIIPDLNLLLYAYNRGAADHLPAKAWWEQLLRSGYPVGIPWIVVLGFLRLSTTRGVFATAATPAAALRRVESWFVQPVVTVLNPGARHLSILRTNLAVTAGGALTTDAHLAALAIEHQAELHSNDADFARFPGLRWRNPIAPKP
jgi:toxin-antitoxin system PIN domain toxin